MQQQINEQRWWAKSLQQRCQELDAEYHIPRPATAQHLPAYQAALHLFGVCGESLVLVCCGFISAFLFVQAAQWFAISIWLEIGAHCLGIISVLIGFLEATQLWLPFYQYNQRVTHGSARWADARTLRDLHLAKRKEHDLER